MHDLPPSTAPLKRGCVTGWRANAVAIAKRNLKAGELLDGEAATSCRPADARGENGRKPAPVLNLRVVTTRCEPAPIAAAGARTLVFR